MKQLIKEIKYWGQLLLIPFYWLSYLFPRSSDIWVLGSTFGNRFTDNPKYFFLYLHQYQKEHTRAIWISKSREVIKLLEENHLEGYYLYSLRGIWFSLRAKVYLYDNYSKDISFMLSGGAIKINLWHGVPLKKIQQDNRFDYVRNPRSRWEKFRWTLRRMSDEKPTDYVLTTSDLLMPIFASAFQTNKVILCGYPRNDNLLIHNIENVLTGQEQQTIKQIKELKEKYKIALYMPTFRNSEAKLFDLLHSEQFQQFLQEENIIFLVKPHPKSRVTKEYLSVSGGSILYAYPEEDPYPLLELADVLVTDYSSIYFDFLITDKPVIFFSYDLKEYLSESREMYFNYEEFTPGVKVHNQMELEEALRHTADCDCPVERDNILRKVFQVKEEFAAEHLYQIVLQILHS
jgi:CDP-glycerol glycerophosphotransferase (TagB/SpsB family)